MGTGWCEERGEKRAIAQKLPVEQTLIGRIPNGCFLRQEDCCSLQFLRFLAQQRHDRNDHKT